MADKVKGTASLVLAFLLAVSMFIFSGQSGKTSTDLSRRTTEFICQTTLQNFNEIPLSEQESIIINLNQYIRKSAHFAIYCLMGIFTYYAIIKFNLKLKFKIAVSVTLCLIYSISDEIHQYFIPGRTFKLTDIIIDVSGALVGVGIVKLLSFIAGVIKNRKIDKSERK